MAKVIGAFRSRRRGGNFHPGPGLIMKWDDDMVESLEAGEYQEIFGE